MSRKTVMKPFTLVNKTPRAVSPAVQPAPVAAMANHGVVVGMPMGISAAGLRPVCRVEVMGDTIAIPFSGTIGVLSQTFVCDPTGTAPNSLAVNNWSNRFSGFQQYRVRSTTWIVVPLRTNVGTTTSSQAPGHIGIWVQDTPQTGAPTTNQFLQANRRFVLCNQERIERITYTTNEPQDLNLADISLPPSHVTGSGVELGQHALQLYGDNNNTGITGIGTGVTVSLFSVTPIYDIEFFGIGGV
jgi:hypothetical protein